MLVYDCAWLSCGKLNARSIARSMPRRCSALQAATCGLLDLCCFASSVSTALLCLCRWQHWRRRTGVCRWRAARGEAARAGASAPQAAADAAVTACQAHVSVLYTHVIATLQAVVPLGCAAAPVPWPPHVRHVAVAAVAQACRKSEEVGGQMCSCNNAEQ